MYVFLEDKNEKDRLFLEAFIKREFSTKVPQITYVKTNGWTGIKKEVITQQLRLNTDNGIKNLIIFDADDNSKIRLEFLKNYISSIKSKADIFLFPDNKHSGELETLLMKLANWEDNSFFLDCYENYLRCLNEQILDPEKYKIPDYKDMVQAYSSFFRKGEIDFHDASFWDFSREEAQALREFLDLHLP